MNTNQTKSINDIVTTGDLTQFHKSLLEDIKQLLQQNATPRQKNWLKSCEVKKLLQVSNGTLQNLRNNGTLPYTKIGGVIYYNRDDIQKMLIQNRQTY